MTDLEIMSTCTNGICLLKFLKVKELELLLLKGKRKKSFRN